MAFKPFAAAWFIMNPSRSAVYFHLSIVFLSIDLTECFFCKGIQTLAVGFCVFEFKDEARNRFDFGHQLYIKAAVSRFAVRLYKITIAEYSTQSKDHSVIKSLVSGVAEGDRFKHKIFDGLLELYSILRKYRLLYRNSNDIIVAL